MVHGKNIQIFDEVLKYAKFGESVSAQLSGVRHANESDQQTLERIINTAKKIICGGCNGRGRGWAGASPYGTECSDCHGTGEKAYDPMMKIVKEVIDI